MTRSERWLSGTWEAFAGQEGSFYKETKGKKVGKVADEIVVPFEGNAAKHCPREGSLLNKEQPKKRRTMYCRR